jgi:hypothetical protein
MGEGTPAAPRRATALAALALALFGGALYARSLGFGFVDFDDPRILLAHPHLYDERSLASSLRHIFVDYFPREEPLLLRDVTWALDARLFGFRNPLGYHLGNVLLNALNGALLFLFLRRATRGFWRPLAVAGVFVALPVHVEPVSWVMGRKDVLSTCFVLAALLAQAAELEEPRLWRRRLLWGLTFVFTALALLSKVAAMSCVLLLGLHRVFHLHLDGRRAPAEPIDWRRARGAPRPPRAHAALTAAVVVGYQQVLAQFGVIGARSPGALSGEHLSNVAWFWPLILGGYLRTLAWPTELSVFYRWPHVEIPLSLGEQLASLGIAAALAVGLAACCLRRRDLAFFALAGLALLAPYLGIFFVDIWRADRYVYLASFAPLWLAAAPLAALARRGAGARVAVAGLAVAALAGNAAYAFRHQAVWKDNESLWRYEADRSEPSLLSIRAIAAEYAAQAERAADPAARRELSQRARTEALRGIEREAALGRQPSGYATNEQYQLGRIHALLGRLDRLDGAPLASQIAHLEESYRLAPYRANAFALANLYLERAAQVPEAERERLVRLSFDRFVQYLAQTSRDPAFRERNAAHLAHVYERNHPFLADAIAAARRSYLQ